MLRSMLSVLAALVLAAVTSTPAAAEPEVSASLVDLADSPKDFRLDKDLRKNKQAVSAGEASDIGSATFAITGAGETAVLEARISVARLMGKKHAYNQAVGLYGYNFQYIVKSDGTASLNTYRKKHPTCAPGVPPAQPRHGRRDHHDAVPLPGDGTEGAGHRRAHVDPPPAAGSHRGWRHHAAGRRRHPRGAVHRCAGPAAVT